MPYPIQIIRVFSGALFTIVFTSSTIATAAEPAWLEDLTWQLAVENECEVDNYLRTHEGKVGGKLVLTARLKCKDGRVLDAHRMEPQETFAIKPCELVIC